MTAYLTWTALMSVQGKGGILGRSLPAWSGLTASARKAFSQRAFLSLLAV